MSAPLPDGRLYAECWHPESPGVRIVIQPSILRRLGIVRSEFATLGETIRYYRDHRTIPEPESPTSDERTKP